ncbi:MAG: GPW/gp25 family protein [Pseudomonadales bacterium]
MNMSFPFHINNRGRMALATDSQYVYQLIEQILFTSPGERINNPNFGSGLLQLVFAPNNDELTTANQFMIQGALQQYLADLVLVESVQVQGEDNRVQVTVQYQIQQTQERRVEQFSSE